MIADGLIVRLAWLLVNAENENSVMWSKDSKCWLFASSLLRRSLQSNQIDHVSQCDETERTFKERSA